MTVRWRRRLFVLTTIIGTVFAGVPTVSAHGGGSYFPGIQQWYALIPLVAGVAIVAGAAYLRRTRYETHPTRALEIAFVGLALAVAGSVALVQLSQITTLTGGGALANGTWMKPTALVVGMVVVVASFVVGRIRWPTRPRYMVLGVCLGFWIAYPGVPQAYQPLNNPVGYLLALTVPATVLYIVYRDCAGPLRTIFADRVARRFGGGVAVLGGLFFMFSAGMLSFLPDPEGTGLQWSHPVISVLPIQNPLVMWPAVEFWIPSIPLSGYLSVGMVALIGMVVGLLAANGAFVAYQWRCRGKTGVSGATGAAALVAPNACCCCGPVLTQFAVVAFGPTAAMPIYWLFIDTGSPLGLMFFAASIVLLLGNVVRFSDALDPSATTTIDTETGGPGVRANSS